MHNQVSSATGAGTSKSEDLQGAFPRLDADSSSKHPRNLQSSSLTVYSCPGTADVLLPEAFCASQREASFEIGSELRADEQSATLTGKNGG